MMAMISGILKSLKVFIERVIYINIKVDLILLEFFGRFYTYPFFIFALLFGHFDSSGHLSDPLILFRFFCFCASTYLISTSIFVLIVFNVKQSKKYLYNLLGEKFVKSKIGNSGEGPAIRYGIPIVAGYIVDTTGKHWAKVDKRETASVALSGTLATVDTSPDLTPGDRRDMTKQAVKDYNTAMNRPVDGPISKHVKIEALKSAWTKVVDSLPFTSRK